MDETILLTSVDSSMVVDYINIMKTAFDYNFDLDQSFKQHGYTQTWKQGEAVN